MDISKLQQDIVAAKQRLAEAKKVRLPAKKVVALEKALKRLEDELCGFTDPLKLYGDDFFAYRFRKYKDKEIKCGQEIVKILKVSSIVDFGCALGHYLEGALQAGAHNVLGFELGYDKAKKYISSEMMDKIHFGDVTKPISCGTFECAMSIEVAEHIRPEFSDQFVDNVSSAAQRAVLITAAPLGQTGVGHINLRPKEFWLERFAQRGCKYDAAVSDALRRSWNPIVRSAMPWLVDNLMVFMK